MHIRKIVLFLLLSVLLTACEGLVGQNGYVYSSADYVPLENVMVVLYLNDKPVDTMFSKANGFFDGSKFVGCVPKCPVAKVTFEKEGYKTKTIVFNKDFYKATDFRVDSVIIKLEKIE